MSKAQKLPDGSSLLSRFRNDKRGNFAMMLGLSIFPLITFFGVAIDYSRVTSAKASLNSAADSAALNAVTQAINTNNGSGAIPTGYVTNPTGTMPTTTTVRAFFNGASRDSQYVGPSNYDPASPAIPPDAPFTYSLFYTGSNGTCPTAMPTADPTGSVQTPAPPVVIPPPVVTPPPVVVPPPVITPVVAPPVTPPNNNGNGNDNGNGNGNGNGHGHNRGNGNGNGWGNGNGNGNGQGNGNGNNSDSDASFSNGLRGGHFFHVVRPLPDMASASGIDYSVPTGTVSTPCTPNSYIATISYSAPIATSILQVVGIDQVTVHGTATAQSKLPSYLNFYVLMDNSPSMGIGGSAADIANLETLTAAQPNGSSCAFACHERNSDGTDDVNDYFHVALAHGVKTRIDYLRGAVGSLLTLASKTQQVPNQFQFGLYTFNDTATQTTVSPLSSNFTQLQTDTQNIQLGYNSVNNPGMNEPGDVNAGPDEETDIDAGVNYVGSQVSTSYTSPRAPTNFVVIVSDGVQDKVDCATVGTTSGGCRAYEPVSLATCDALKQAGNQVAVVYTPYLPITNNGWYNKYVEPINIQPVPSSANLPQVTNVMQSCASNPSLFVETSPTTDIGTALQTIFQNALARTLLTN